MRRITTCLEEDAPRRPEGEVFVGIDVIRAATTAVTAVATGRTCYLASTEREARQIAASLPGALLAGELGGVRPCGFELDNSPAALHARTDVDRPLVLVSSSGTRLLRRAARLAPTVVGCLRTIRATVGYLVHVDADVTILLPLTRGEVRLEDAWCAARIADGLEREGLRPDADTRAVQRSMEPVPLSALGGGRSAAFLRRSEQTHDLRFVVEHVDDMEETFVMLGRQVVAAASTRETVG